MTPASLPAFLRVIIVAVAATLLGAVIPAVASATHEQGGFITASVTADGQLKGKFSYLTTGSCTVGTETGAYPITVESPLGTTEVVDTLPAKYTRCVPGSTTQQAEFDVNLATTFSGVAPDGAYTVTFSSCCRVSGIRNVVSTATSFTASARKITGSETSSPRLESNVSTGVAVSYEYAQFLNASDPDGGTLTYQSRAGQSDGPSTDVVSYTSDGWVKIPASTTATWLNNWTFVYKVRVIDSQGDFAEREVLLRVTANNKPPVFGGVGSDPVQVAPGQTRAVTVAASDPNNAAPKVDSVSISAVGLPSWATLTSTQGNPATATLTLSPPANTPTGNVGINLDAVDNDSIAALTATANLQVQVTAPAPAITSAPASVAKTASFAFNGDGAASYECRIDGGSWDACTSPYAPTGLSDGSHKFEVRAVGGGGDRSSTAEHNWTQDTGAPAAPGISAAPAARTADRSPSFTFAGESGGSFECRIDAGSWESCSSPQSYVDVAAGNRTFAVRQTDAAGNIGAEATHQWEAGYQPPAPQITSAPSNVASSAASFAFSGTDATGYECRIDGGAWVGCTSPYQPTGLADGAHKFEVRSLASGTTSLPTAHDWTIDTAGPGAPAIVGAPAISTPATDAKFDFSGEAGGSFECSIDGGAWEPCVSPKSYAGQAAGKHTFQVRQTDGAGNRGSAATFEWEAGVQPPADPEPEDPKPEDPKPEDPPAEQPPLHSVLPPNATAEVHGDEATVGCKVADGALASCGIKAYALDQPGRRDVGVVDSSAKLSASAKQRRWVFIGRGFVRSDGGASRLAVDIKLNARGRRLMARSIAGIRVKLKMKAETMSGAKISTKKKANFVPARQLVVPSTGTFESGKARLTPRGQAFLRTVARHLRPARKIRCAGHTDAIGTSADNRLLGKRRAASACRFLRRAGVRAKFVAVSYGEARPRATNATVRGRALNRRIELALRYR